MSPKNNNTIYDEVVQICGEYEMHLEVERLKQKEKLKSKSDSSFQKADEHLSKVDLSMEGLKQFGEASKQAFKGIGTQVKSKIPDINRDHKFNAIFEIHRAANKVLNKDAPDIEAFKEVLQEQQKILEISRNKRKETGGTALDTIIAKFFKAIEKVLNTFGSSLVTGKRTTNKLFDAINKHEKAKDQPETHQAKKHSEKTNEIRARQEARRPKK